MERVYFDSGCFVRHRLGGDGDRGVDEPEPERRQPKWAFLAQHPDVSRRLGRRRCDLGSHEMHGQRTLQHRTEYLHAQCLSFINKRKIIALHRCLFPIVLFLVCHFAWMARFVERICTAEELGFSGNFVVDADQQEMGAAVFTLLGMQAALVTVGISEPALFTAEDYEDFVEGRRLELVFSESKGEVRISNDGERIAFSVVRSAGAVHVTAARKQCIGAFGNLIALRRDYQEAIARDPPSD